MENNAIFKITDIASITLEDPDANTNPAEIETLVGNVNGIQIFSDSDPPASGGIFIDLIETGPDTREFSGHFRSLLVFQMILQIPFWLVREM